mmetsp:Transcript_9782/g.20479  ORF Transcript_9782/g.20479 Transcript_9782/m.20479 type:complete len:558 (+) Transcript_9782:103-1776(+)
MSENLQNNDSTELEEEGIEASALANRSEEGTSNQPSFSVFPALSRSESFIRRRVQKREGQEKLVKKTFEGMSTNPRKSNPIDLDELEEEEAIQRHSTHGAYGILPSSQYDGGQYRSYRRDHLINEIDAANNRGLEGHGQVLETLRNARILVYIIDAKVCVTLSDVVDGIRRVVDHVCRDPQHRDHPNNQKCLLYRDYDGRLFNLVLTSQYSNLDSSWRSNFESFSIVQAAALFTFLTRSLSCAFELEATDDFRQVYLVVILGVVFTEEISLSWTNVALLVRGYPSMSAYALTSSVVGTDWLRKLIVLMFVVSSASRDDAFRKYCTLGGIILTCLVLLANLGSLSWKYLHWKSFKGISLFGNSDLPVLDPLLAYFVAVLTGICFPFMGHSKIEAGGTAAIESVMRISLIVATLFILSDYDAFQRILVIGSEACNQDYVNFCVGTWWSISLMASLTLLYCKEINKDKKFDPFKRDYTFPNDEEPLLEEEHKSPTGYKVPHLPSFPVNPSYTHKGLGSRCSYFQLGMEYALSLVIVLAVGTFICYLGVTRLDDQFLTDNF